jgi:hypothetical protein
MDAKFNKDSFFVRVGYTQDDISVAISNITKVTSFVADPLLVPMQENLPGDLAVIKLATAVQGITFPVSAELLCYFEPQQQRISTVAHSRCTQPLLLLILDLKHELGRTDRQRFRCILRASW